jgi:hypothetical protein
MRLLLPPLVLGSAGQVRPGNRHVFEKRTLFGSATADEISRQPAA